MNTSDDNDIPDPLLEHMPLVPLPDGFTRRIMVRLVLQAHFRLRFIDLAMPVFAILFLPVVMGVGWWVMTLIDPLWLAQARLELAFRWMVLPDATRVLLLLSASISLVLALVMIGAGMLAWTASNGKAGKER